MVYGLSSVRSYDALGIKSISSLFSESFPDQNMWGNPDSVSEKSLKTFGVRYLLSDYDLRMDREILSSSSAIRMPIITSSSGYETGFIATTGRIGGVRILTANFNRLNTCFLHVSILQNGKVLEDSKIDCRIIPDKMFLFVPFQHLVVFPGQKYTVQITSNGASGNGVALWGENDPFFGDILHPFRIVGVLSLRP